MAGGEVGELIFRVFAVRIWYDRSSALQKPEKSTRLKLPIVSSPFSM
jgi:hypothetical protein